MSINMGPKTLKLAKTLERLIFLLREDEQYEWAKWMTQAHNWINNSDFSGIEKVLSAYGGMGSFNDTYIRHNLRKNNEFDRLRSRAWELACEISHEAEIDTYRSQGSKV